MCSNSPLVAMTQCSNPQRIQHHNFMLKLSAVPTPVGDFLLELKAGRCPVCRIRTACRDQIPEFSRRPLRGHKRGSLVLQRRSTQLRFKMQHIQRSCLGKPGKAGTGEGSQQPSGKKYALWTPTKSPTFPKQIGGGFGFGVREGLGTGGVGSHQNPRRVSKP